MGKAARRKRERKAWGGVVVGGSASPARELAMLVGGLPSVRAALDRPVPVEDRPLKPGELPPWTRFKRATNRPMSEARIEQLIAEGMALGQSRELTLTAIAKTEQDEIWINSRYQVNIERHLSNEGGPALVHLSIKRRDKEVPGQERWRDFQRIKSELVGPECEGVELYPAESRVVDTANQFHVWVVDSPSFRWPVGFNDGRLVSGPQEGSTYKQRPMEDAQA